MRIALAQLNYKVGEFEKNVAAILKNIDRARDEKADLVIFSELSVCGYPPQDLLERRAFIEESDQALDLIAEKCTDIAAIVGAPRINEQSKGKSLYNAALFLYQGKVFFQQNKTLLPTYDIFDEHRYFEANDVFNLVEFKGKKIALTVCEDLWYCQPFDNAFSKESLYKKSPMEQLAAKKTDFIVNIAASPFSYTRIWNKKNIFIRNAKNYQLPLFYVNQVGAQTELIFDGASMVVNPDGNIADEMACFKEDFRVYQLEEISSGNMDKHVAEETNVIEKIHDALILGIRDYFEKIGLKKATLGLSGGIDSAVSLVLAERALGKENLRVLLLPSQYSSEHSVADAKNLAENLGVQYDVINIQEVVDEFNKSLSGIFAGKEEDITEENIQARTRGTILMALSNKFGHILLNTSNKSEAAVGYGTLYGDMNGGLSVLGDVYKMDVYKLARFINKKSEIIPDSTIVKPPSAELRPDQKDSDSLPDYQLLDEILFRYIELQKSRDEIVEEGYEQSIVEKVVALVNKNEYKRYQAPPILRISSKAFGAGRRMPLVADY